jgi:hypothetical protein
MFFHSKLFNFLLSLLGYAIFAFSYIYNFKATWYSNIPEETRYFKVPDMSIYKMYGYLFLISFILFLIFGIVYLVKDQVLKVINYILIGDLFFTTYYVWHYSTTIKGFGSPGIVMFFTLMLFAISMCKVAGLKQNTIPASTDIQL